MSRSLRTKTIPTPLHLSGRRFRSRRLPVCLALTLLLLLPFSVLNPLLKLRRLQSSTAPFITALITARANASSWYASLPPPPPSCPHSAAVAANASLSRLRAPLFLLAALPPPALCHLAVQAAAAPSSPLLILHAQNGLGNRLRAVASALEAAHTLSYIPVIIWPRDAHLNASFSALFAPTVLDHLVVTSAALPWPLPHIPPSTAFHQSPSLSSLNLMRKETPALPSPLPIPFPRTHIYVKSAFILPSAILPPSPFALTDHLLQLLTPSQSILARVSSLNAHSPLAPAIGVHVRHRPVQDEGVALDAACEYPPDSVATANAWRSLASPHTFAAAMRHQARLAEPTYAAVRARETRLSTWLSGRQSAPREKVRFFLAADGEDVAAGVLAACPECDIFSMDSCRSRGEECVVAAFADMIALSRCGAMLLSGWSSFSEGAKRLRVRSAEEVGREVVQGRFEYPALLSGEDFGRRGARETVVHQLDRFLGNRRVDKARVQRSDCGKRGKL